MRYLTSNAMNQIDLEETVAWEQLEGFRGNGDDDYAAYKPPPVTAPVTTPVKPLVRADPYAGIRPRGPSTGVGTGSHGAAYTPITEAVRVTKAPTPERKEPEYKMPAQQPGQPVAKKVEAKFDCAAWRLKRCAALSRLLTARGTVTQMQAAKASEGAISMAKDNTVAAQKEYDEADQDSDASDCFKANPAQRLCPGEKKELSYVSPPRGGYPGPYGAAVQALMSATYGLTAQSKAAPVTPVMLRPRPYVDTRALIAQSLQRAEQARVGPVAAAVLRQPVAPYLAARAEIAAENTVSVPQAAANAKQAAKEKAEAFERYQADPNASNTNAYSEKVANWEKATRRWYELKYNVQPAKTQKRVIFEPQPRGIPTVLSKPDRAFYVYLFMSMIAASPDAKLLMANGSGSSEPNFFAYNPALAQTIWDGLKLLKTDVSGMQQTMRVAIEQMRHYRKIGRYDLQKEVRLANTANYNMSNANDVATVEMAVRAQKRFFELATSSYLAKGGVAMPGTLGAGLNDILEVSADVKDFGRAAGQRISF